MKKTSKFQIFAALVLAALISGHTVRARQQTQIGYSYLKLVIGGTAMQNLERNREYAGWLELDGVDARLFPVPAKPASEKQHRAGWTSVDKFLRDHPGHSGELDFGVGDIGGLDPMLDAMKRKAVIPEADLDYFNYDTNVLVGKYKLTGVRILSMKDVPASACAMYDVVIRFDSIAAR